MDTDEDDADFGNIGSFGPLFREELEASPDNDANTPWDSDPDDPNDIASPGPSFEEEIRALPNEEADTPWNAEPDGFDYLGEGGVAPKSQSLGKGAAKGKTPESQPLVPFLATVTGVSSFLGMRNRSLSPTVSTEAMTASPTERRAVGTGGRPILRTSDTLPGSPAKRLLFRTEESGGFGAGESEEYLVQSPVNPRPCSISATSSLQQQTEVPAKKSPEKTPSKPPKSLHVRY